MSFRSRRNDSVINFVTHFVTPEIWSPIAKLENPYIPIYIIEGVLGKRFSVASFEGMVLIAGSRGPL